MKNTFFAALATMTFVTMSIAAAQEASQAPSRPVSDTPAIRYDARYVPSLPQATTPLEFEEDLEDKAAAAKVPPCQGLPDLRPIKVLTSSSLVIGQNLNSMSVEVKNFGVQPAGNFFVRVKYCPLSGPCNMTSPDFGVGSFSGTLAPFGSGTTVNITPVLYTGVKPGVFRFIVIVDDTSIVKECNEFNNRILSNPVKFIPHCSRPDLYGIGTGFNPALMTVNKGATATVSASVMNQGGSPNNPGVVRLALREVNNNSITWISTWAGSLGPLPSGHMQHFTQVPIQIPSNLPPGKYTWLSLFDAQNTTPNECSESNNWNPPNGPVFTVN